MALTHRRRDHRRSISGLQSTFVCASKTHTRVGRFSFGTISHFFTICSAMHEVSNGRPKKASVNPGKFLESIKTTSVCRKLGESLGSVEERGKVRCPVQSMPAFSVFALDDDDEDDDDEEDDDDDDDDDDEDEDDEDDDDDDDDDVGETTVEGSEFGSDAFPCGCTSVRLSKPKRNCSSVIFWQNNSC